MTDQAAFLAVLYTGPILHADAIVVFSGDGKVRLDTAVQALKQGAAYYVVVSGGVDNPPHSLHADEAARYLVSSGLQPSRIVKDAESMNTRDQAVWLAKECQARGWKRVLLVASHYHMPRAFLTCVKAMADERVEDVHVVPLPAYAPWWERPEGMSVSRVDLLDSEAAKIREYGARGDVASYADGLAYLRLWECGPDDEQEAA